MNTIIIKGKKKKKKSEPNELISEKNFNIYNDKVGV